MSAHSQLSRGATLIASLALVAVGALVVVRLTPNSATLEDQHGMPGEVSADSGAAARLPIVLRPEKYRALPVDTPAPYSPDGRFVRYDNIVVEVKKDGTLRVLGEQMGMTAFRSLLGRQMNEPLPMMVTIRPDDDCIFRHVGPVITVCEEAGVRHKTQINPTSVARLPGDPA